MDLFKHFPLLTTNPHRDLKYAKELTDRYSSHHFQNKENDSSPTKIKTGSIWFLKPSLDIQFPYTFII